MDAEDYFVVCRSRVEAALMAALPPEGCRPARLTEAIRYSVMVGGKRIRPMLCLAAAEAAGGAWTAAVPAAVAIELLHTYTLVHDDLPCMDNDDLRRGKPTLHKVYPENIALLAGDGLLTLSFEILAANSMKHPERGLKAVADLALLTGSQGVIGGQVLDLLAENREISPSELEEIHHNKTAKLLMASVRMGAILSGAEEDALNRLTEYGRNIGHAFQIADDILDEIGDVKKLGKNPGQDKKLHKATYVKFFGLEKAKLILDETIEKAVSQLKPFGEKAETLRDVACYIGQREN